MIGNPGATGKHPRKERTLAIFRKRTRIPASAEAVFDWHRRPEALLDLTPPGDPTEMVERTGGIDEVGSRVVLSIGRGPLRLTWVAEHTHCEPGRMFRDVQRKGPFARWVHTHRMDPDGPEACWLEDHIDYAVPFGPLGEALGGWFVRRKLEAMFTHRHAVTLAAFAEPARGDRP